MRRREFELACDRHFLLVCLLMLGLIAALFRYADGRDPRPVDAGSLADFLRAEKVRLYAAHERTRHFLPTQAQIKRFTEGLRALREYEERADPLLLDRARGLLRSVNYELVADTQGHWYLRDRIPGRGWGHYAINRAPRDRLLVEVPRALDERHALEAGLALYYETGARALAIAGAPGDRIDVLNRIGTFFHAFHRLHAQEEVLAVRSPAYAPAAASPGWTPGVASRLWVNGRLPAALELAALREWVGGTLVPVWKAAPADSLQRRTTPAAYAELYLSGDDAMHMIALLEPRTRMLAQWQEEAARQRLAEALQPASAVAQAAEPLASWRLAYLEQEVLAPLVRLAANGYRRGKWTPNALAQMRALHYLAEQAGYALSRVHDRHARKEYLMLAERSGAARYVLRAGGGDNYAVNVPDAGDRALAYGLKLFDALKARALLMGGAVIETAGAPERNVAAVAARLLQRELGEEAFLTVVSRDLHPHTSPALQADVALAFADGAMSRREVSPIGARLLGVLQRSGLSYSFVEAPAQAFALHGDVATLWLSPEVQLASARAATAAARKPGAPQIDARSTATDAGEAGNPPRRASLAWFGSETRAY